MTQEEKIRYSDAELEEFRVLIEEKIVKAEEELSFTHKQISDLNDTGFNQQGGDWYDDTSSHTDLEMLQRMAARQEQFISNLRNALFRIGNKTYGICNVTGALIDKQRLKLVPHATKSVAGKSKANDRNSTQSMDTLSRLENEKKRTSNGTPVEGKVRMQTSNARRPAASFDWDGPDQATLENAGI